MKMNSKILINCLFFMLGVCSNSEGAELSLDKDTTIETFTIKGRLSEVNYKKDYHYLHYLADILFYGSLENGYSLEAMRKLSPADKKAITENVMNRIGALMVGGGAGLIKREEATINPENRWKSIQAIKLMAEANHRHALHIGFSDFFKDLSKTTPIKKEGISEQDYQNHLNILSGLGVAANEAVKKFNEESKNTLTAENRKKQGIPIEALIDNFAVSIETNSINKVNSLGLPKDSMDKITILIKKYGLCKTQVRRGSSNKEGNEYGILFDKTPVLSNEMQMHRLKDFVSFRKNKNLLVRLALGVTNRPDEGNDTERKRFQDSSWVVCDQMEDDLNFAGSIFLTLNIIEWRNLLRLAKELDEEKIFFDEIIIDRDVAPQLIDFDLRCLSLFSYMLKDGGTFQCPLYVGLMSTGKNKLFDLEKPIEKLMEEAMNFPYNKNQFGSTVSFFGKDLKTKKGTKKNFHFFPTLDLSMEMLMDDKYINHFTKKWFIPFLNKTLVEEKIFSKVEILENKSHHMDIYDGPVEHLFIGHK